MYTGGYTASVRTLIVADVHSNLNALQAVVADAESGGAIDAVWSLGDVVGYGPEPNRCIEILRSYPLTAIAGNHDEAASGRIDTEEFNPNAAAAAEWTIGNLTDDARDWLRTLPETAIEGDFTLVHGALTDPIWQYLLNQRDAKRHLDMQRTPYGLVGHSHMPLTFVKKGRGIDGTPLSDRDTIELQNTSFVANPGSVGQPRDGDPRAAYAILDTSAAKISFRRVAYDIAATQAAMMAVGLPPSLAERLSRGR